MHMFTVLPGTTYALQFVVSELDMSPDALRHAHTLARQVGALVPIVGQNVSVALPVLFLAAQLTYVFPTVRRSAGVEEFSTPSWHAESALVVSASDLLIAYGLGPYLRKGVGWKWYYNWMRRLYRDLKSGFQL